MVLGRIVTKSSQRVKCLVREESSVTPVGKRIYLKREMLGVEAVNQSKSIPAFSIADVTGRSCAVSPCIRLVSSPKAQTMVRPAYTVKYKAGDNLALCAVLSMCNEGDVIAVSSEEDSTRALIGKIIMVYLRYTKKVAGIVLDDPIHDIDEIDKWDFPVYYTGAIPGGPYREEPGEVNILIACGGISVDPGDIVLADPDGAIVTPRKDTAVILEETKKFQTADRAKLEALKNDTAKREWVDRVLETEGFEIIDNAYRP